MYINSLKPDWRIYASLNWVIVGSDNSLWPVQRKAIIWTNAGMLLIGPLRTHFTEILIEIQTFSLRKIRLKMSFAKCCSFRLGLNVLTALPGSMARRHRGLALLKYLPFDISACLMVDMRGYLTFMYIYLTFNWSIPSSMSSLWWDNRSSIRVTFMTFTCKSIVCLSEDIAF